MSKDIEVGDIFYSEEHKLALVITFIKYSLIWGLWETGQSFSCWKYDDIRKMAYVGKSKANLSDLFKTENE